jgi:hypothetical protein
MSLWDCVCVGHSDIDPLLLLRLDALTPRMLVNFTLLVVSLYASHVEQLIVLFSDRVESILTSHIHSLVTETRIVQMSAEVLGRTYE